jgi:hypothetical protein
MSLLVFASLLPCLPLHQDTARREYQISWHLRPVRPAKEVARAGRDERDNLADVTCHLSTFAHSLPRWSIASSLAPHYEEAATELKSKNIKLAKVDCTVEAELCQDFGIQGYPSVRTSCSPCVLQSS